MADEPKGVNTLNDAGVGKTCLLLKYTTGDFPDKYVPTIFDTYSTELTVNTTTFTFELWDTAGSETMDVLRKLAYGDTDIFFVVYSIDKPDSIKNARTKWVADIRNETPVGTPFLLAENKVDLRDDESFTKPLSPPGEGAKLAEELGAVGFHEVSAVTDKGIKEAFEQIVSHCFHKLEVEEGVDEGATKAAYVSKKKKGRCVLL